MTTLSEEIKQAIVGIVGPDRFTDGIADRISYSSDSSEHRRRPDGAVWVETAGEVSALLLLANEHRLPVVPRGAGTGFAGGAVPEQGGLILDMAHMNRILEICIEDRLVVVQPGVVYSRLAEALDPHGFFFPPDPASGSVATLGGNVATNAGGLRGAKYGVTRDYVLGLEVVLPQGEILRTGTRTMKSVSGYDLTRLFVGSEGTLGVITEISLKVHPKPRVSTACSAAFDEIEEAGEAISEVMRSGVIPCALEILDAECIKALNENTDLDLPEAAALVLAEADAHTREEANHQVDQIVRICERHNAREMVRAESSEEIQRLWTARKSIGGILFRMGYNMLAEDATVPISKVPDMLKGIRGISERHGVLIATLGHLGDGNMHPNIIFDGRNPEERAGAERATRDLFELAVGLGGTLSGEHGIGLAKAEFMPLQHSPVALKTMAGLKRFFDPNNILNPGKLALGT